MFCTCSSNNCFTWQIIMAGTIQNVYYWHLMSVYLYYVWLRSGHFMLCEDVKCFCGYQTYQTEVLYRFGMTIFWGPSQGLTYFNMIRLITLNKRLSSTCDFNAPACSTSISIVAHISKLLFLQGSKHFLYVTVDMVNC